MAERNAARTEIAMVGDADYSGDVIAHWLEWSSSHNFVDPLTPFRFTVGVGEAEARLWDWYRKRLQPGNLVQLRINDAPQLTNVIHTVEETGGSEGIMFSVETESVLSLPYEGGVDPDIAKSFNAETSVLDVVVEALTPYGFDEVVVDAADNVSAMTGRGKIGGTSTPVAVDELKEKEIQAKDGETGYGFCSRIFTRLGVMLMVDWAGTLLIVRPNYTQDVAYTLLEDSEQGYGMEGTFILGKPGVSIRNTNKGQFSHLFVRGKRPDKDGQTRVTEPYAFLEVPGAVYPETAPFQKFKRTQLPANLANYRPGPGTGYKPKFWRDDEASDAVRCSRKAHVMHGARASSGYEIGVTVDGLLAHNGRLWTFNTIARVFLQRNDTDEDMWIRQVDRTEVKDGGATTKLTLIPKGALILEEP